MLSSQYQSTSLTNSISGSGFRDWIISSTASPLVSRQLHGLYQDSQTSHSTARGDGDASDSIHKRYPSNGQIHGATGQSGSRTCYFFKNLGFLINQKKSILEPSQTMVFLGFTVDTVAREIKLPSDKLKIIRVEYQRLEKEEVISAGSLAWLIGKMNATSPVIPSMGGPWSI